ncbi:MAG: TonB-dependent receptor [Bacteroidota bacterium]|nr:TonB-dependent receptor [Bacteroidota bacterium]
MKKKLSFKIKIFRFKRFGRKSYSAYNSMHKAVTIGVVSIMTLTFSNVSKSQNNTTLSYESTLKEKTLEEIVVQDSTLLPINQVGKNVTVITNQDISNLKVQSVEELLSTIASVDMQTRGRHGVQSDVSLRGGNFDQTAILIDGINVSNPQTGHYSMDIPINLSDIERIEILKGPSAIIYGASALSGGINIITKKNQPNGFYSQSEIGQHGFANIENSISKQIKNTSNSLSIGYKTSNGYIKNSAYDVYNLLYRNRTNLKNNNKIDFLLGYNYKDYDANTFYSAKYPNQHDKTSSFLASFKGYFDLFSNNLKFIPSAYYNLHTDDYELIKGSEIGHNHHNSNVIGTNLDFQYYKNNFSLNFGTDLRYEDVLSNTLGEKTNIMHGDYFDHYKQRLNISYFLQGNYAYKGFVATLGLLSFYNTMIEQEDFNLYPSLNLSYRFSSHFDIYACFTSASRLPSYTELYYSDAIHKSNPELKQEKSSSYEGGLKYRNRYFLADFSVFYTQGKDLIDWMQETESEGIWQSRNINELNKYGFDFSTKIFLSEFIDILSENSTLMFAYSYLQTDKAKTNYISQYVFNYLKHKISANLSMPFAKDFRLNLLGKYCVREGQYVSYQNNNAGEYKDYRPFFTMDANLDYSLNSMINVYLSITNIFDKEYYEIGNIPQPGRWTIFGVKFQI